MTLKKIKDFLKLLLINISIGYFLLLMANLFIRENHLTEENLIVNIKRWGKNKKYIGFADKEYLEGIDGKIDSEFELITGEFGDIKLENNSNSSKGEIDYLFFGGSTTECLYVNPQMRFPFLVNKSLDDSIHVVNLSKSGKNSHHSFIQLITQMDDIQINNLFLMHNVNDLTQLLYSNSYTKGVSTRRSVIEYDELLEIKNKPFYIPYNLIDILKKSFRELYPNTYNKIRKIRFLDFMKDNVDEFQNYRTKENKIDEKIFKKFENSLKLFVSFSDIKGTNLILMTQFNRFESDDNFIRSIYNKSNNALDYESFIYAYKKFNDIIRKVSLENDLTLLDLDSLIPKNKDYIYDMVHLTEKGSLLVSEKILEKVNK